MYIFIETTTFINVIITTISRPRMNSKDLKEQISNDFSPYQVSALMKIVDFCKSKDVTDAMNQIQLAKEALAKTEENLMNKLPKIVEELLLKKYNDSIQDNLKAIEMCTEERKRLIEQEHKEQEGLTQLKNADEKMVEDIKKQVKEEFEKLERVTDTIKEIVNTSVRKGTAFEYHTKELLENDGFYVLRSERSLGAFDLVASNEHGQTLYIQCKLNGKISKNELLMLKEEIYPKVKIDNKMTFALMAKREGQQCIGFYNIFNDESNKWPLIFEEDGHVTFHHHGKVIGMTADGMLTKDTECSFDKISGEQALLRNP